MAKKKVTKSKKNDGENDSETSESTKAEKSKNDKQFFWFVLAIAVVFGAFLIPYFLIENSKYFAYANAEWAIEEYDSFTAYHVRFPRIDSSGYNHNVWFRNDPRDLDVLTSGDFNYFRFGGVVAYDKVTGECVGDLTRASIDLTSFVKDGIGARSVEIGTTDPGVALATGRDLVNCHETTGKTVVILKEGSTSVVQDDLNKYCYTINVETCDDIDGIEAFMLKVLEDSLEPIEGS